MQRKPMLGWFKFCCGTHGLFEELGRNVNKGGSQECPNWGALNCQLSMFCLSLQHMSSSS